MSELERTIPMRGATLEAIVGEFRRAIQDAAARGIVVTDNVYPSGLVQFSASWTIVFPTLRSVARELHEPIEDYVRRLAEESRAWSEEIAAASSKIADALEESS